MSTSSESTGRTPTSAPALWLPWNHWETVGVNISQVPKEATTRALWEAFSKEGEICSIDIFDDRHGNRGSKGRVRFKYVPISLATYFHLVLATLEPGTPCESEMLIKLHPKQASSSKVLLAEWNL